MCPLISRNTIRTHTSRYTKKTYNINSPINCKTCGVVYRIFCDKCPNFSYIGETSRELKRRILEHYRDAENKDKTKPCGLHCSLPGHSENNLSFIGIENVFPKSDTLLRRRRERFWIKNI